MEKYVKINNEEILIKEVFYIRKEYANFTFIFEIEHIEEDLWEIFIHNRMYGEKILCIGACDRLENMIQYIHVNYKKCCEYYIEKVFDEEDKIVE